MRIRIIRMLLFHAKPQSPQRFFEPKTTAIFFVSFVSLWFAFTLRYIVIAMIALAVCNRFSAS